VTDYLETLDITSLGAELKTHRKVTRTDYSNDGRVETVVADEEYEVLICTDVSLADEDATFKLVEDFMALWEWSNLWLRLAAGNVFAKPLRARVQKLVGGNQAHFNVVLRVIGGTDEYSHGLAVASIVSVSNDWGL